MNTKRKPVLDLFIEFNGKILEMKHELGQVVMIPFKGTAKGEIFNGIIEPCGVDTQIVNAVNVRHLSARYMLTGKDSAGEDCHIYVENNGWFDDTHPSEKFRTVPTFYTDSKVLAKYLHQNRFEGEGVSEEDGLHIYFYEVEGIGNN